MMNKIILPQRTLWATLMQRPLIDNSSLELMAQEVFDAVRERGNDAVQAYNIRFDGNGQTIDAISSDRIMQAGNLISAELKSAILLAAKNIRTFHETQRENIVKTNTMPGVTCWRESRAIERIGLYIPGGSAPLFSTVLMLGIPAQLAGCPSVALCTPMDSTGNIHPAILYAASLSGITNIYGIGGMQAIAAMSIGTETIHKADKIFGPGNQYVMAAKQLAQRTGVGIDLPAGPSEVLIIADSSCNPAYVAADLLSQAEHGSDSQVMLLSDNEMVLDKCLYELGAQLQLLPRKEIAADALKNSKAILLSSLTDCMAFSNQYAPEHLIIASDYHEMLQKDVVNAGSVFLGNYSCESAGDYASGTNHTLPTNGYARSYSGVSLDSFVKKITFQQLTREGIRNIGPAIELMAEAEQLWAHKNAATIRLNDLSNV